MKASILSILLLTLLPYIPIYGQVPDSTYSTASPAIPKKRLSTLAWVSTSTYTVSMAGLYHLWYKDSEQQSFRFFNDNREWKQIDKIGHALSSFYLSYGASKALQWTQMPEKKCDLVGASLGFLLLVPIEIFDGFSEAYGASTGDLIADAGGSLLYLGQKKLWNEPRIFPKFSFHTTRYASIRPNTLGDSYLSQVLKDYNGQTYWLSFDIDKFIQFPKWLNLAAGYGAEGMVYARDLQNRLQGYRAYRQYYLSLDFDLKSIKSKSKVVNTLLFFANIIKLPAPAFSFSNNGTTFRALYF